MEKNICDRCKTLVDSSQAHCPLCGRCVNDNIVDKRDKYPDYKSFDQSNFHRAGILMRGLVILTIVAILANLIIDIESLWSMYVLSGAIALHLVVLVPIRYKTSFALQMKFITLGVSQLLLAIELMSHTFGWGMGYAIPLLLLTQMVTCAVLALRKGYINFEYVRPTIFLLFWSLVVFILNCYVLDVVHWPSVSAFLLCLACFSFLLLFRFKRTINSIKKYYKF